MIEALVAITLVWLISKRLHNGTFVVHSSTHISDDLIQTTIDQKQLSRAPRLPYESFEGLKMNSINPIVPDDEHPFYQPQLLQRWLVQPRAAQRELPTWL